MKTLLLLALLAQADAPSAIVEPPPHKPTVWHVLTRDDAGLLPVWDKEGAIIMNPSTYDLINQEMIRLQKVEASTKPTDGPFAIFLAIGIVAITGIALGCLGVYMGIHAGWIK